MAVFFVRRIAAALLLVFVLVSLLFFLLRLAPGQPADLFFDPRLEPAQREQLIRLYGLDRPLLVQYTRWLEAILLRWDWGTSFSHGRPVSRVLAEALPNTLLLGLAAFVLEYVFALGFGVLAAWRRESALDHALRGLSMVLFSLPVFWLALMAMLLFSFVWPIFPPSHMYSAGMSELPLGQRLGDLAWHLTLPAGVLALAAFGNTLRLVRSSLLEVLGQDFIRSARARGLPERRVLLVHALRNAAVPVAQMAGVALPALLNGSLVIEVIFSWPGLGQVMFQAVSSADYPLVLAGTALSGALVVAGSLAADFAHAALDPRVRRA